MLAKRINGINSEREKIISLIKINYNVNEKNLNKKLQNLRNLLLNNQKDLNCFDLSKKINSYKQYKSVFLKSRIADFNELLIKQIKEDNLKQIINPIYFNNFVTTFYLCKILPPKNLKPTKEEIKERLMNKKIRSLRLRLIKKLKKESNIIIKKSF